jgi:2-polyprenyl-3-methyl-5-hydroxy-6-metoxy-1,4-benzoquinol methylase
MITLTKRGLMPDCNVCGTVLDQPIYTSIQDISVDSRGELHRGRTQVFFCDHCGHSQTRELENVEKYYSEDYNFLVNQEDQLYRIVDDRKIYRTDHELSILQKKIQLPQKARVLDYGCGKGDSLRRLCSIRPDIIPHLFDVSEAYLPFWEKFLQPEQWSTYTPKPEWISYFDTILSFFALEHITQPKQALTTIASLLKPGGYFYFVVPNIYGIYIADLLVIDHVNHFSESSIQYIIEESGLKIINIDTYSHDTAFVVVTQKVEQVFSKNSFRKGQINCLKEHILGISRFWREVPGRLQAFESQHRQNGDAAIYGAGIVGSFIASHLKDFARVAYFVDRNPHKQHQGMLGKPVISPERLDTGIKTIYVGLNPQAGREAIEKVEAWQSRQHHYFYL